MKEKKKPLTEEERKKVLSEFGRIGGTALFKKRGRKYMQEMAKKANEVRWGKKKKTDN